MSSNKIIMSSSCITLFYLSLSVRDYSNIQYYSGTDDNSSSDTVISTGIITPEENPEIPNPEETLENPNPEETPEKNIILDMDIPEDSSHNDEVRFFLGGRQFV